VLAASFCAYSQKTRQQEEEAMRDLMIEVAVQCARLERAIAAATEYRVTDREQIEQLARDLFGPEADDGA
jgi:hypothetical protein